MRHTFYSTGRAITAAASALVEKCRVSFTVPGCRIEGDGLFGIIAVIVLGVLVILGVR
jgi:hypothetical protein